MSDIPGGTPDATVPASDPGGFRSLVEHSDHMIARHHPDGRFFYVSPACETLLGYAPRDLLGTGLAAILHPSDVAPLAGAYARDTPLRVAARVRRRDGSHVWCHLTARWVRDPRSGVLLEIQSSMREAADTHEGTTSRRREEAARTALADQEALLRVAKSAARGDPPERIFSLVTEEAAQLLDADASHIAQFDAGYAVVRGAWGQDTPAAGRRFPLMGDRPVAQVDQSGVPARSDSYAELRARDAASARIIPAGYTSGVAAPIFVRARPWGVLVTSRVSRTEPFPRDAEHRLARFAELVALAICSSDAREELMVRATTDSLTGLAGHRTFHDRLAREIERARRHGHRLSLAVLDIDNFKLVNDRHGHLVGDTVLVEVARRLTALARAGDVVGRMGGEEFAWLLPETDIDSAAAAARRACRAIRDVPFPRAGVITASVGVCGGTAGADAAQIYLRADEALYRAKALGRDRVVATPLSNGAGTPSPAAEVS